MSPVLVIARYAIQEAVRRRVFTVVLALTAAFVALYGLAVWQVFRKIGDIHPPGGSSRSPSRAPPSSASRCSPPCSSASCSASS